MNHYEILQVDYNNSTQEIKQAYFKNAKKYHPDHNQGNEIESAEHFKKIQEAYLTLSDPFKRQMYNLQQSEIIFEQQEEKKIFVFIPNPQYSIFQNFAIGISQSFLGITLGGSAIILSGVTGISGIAWSIILTLPYMFPYSSLLLLILVGLTHSIQTAQYQIANMCFRNGLTFLCAGIKSGINSITYAAKNIYINYFTISAKKQKDPIDSAKVPVDTDWVFI
jgi:hypothetical protein